ncbi:hypothetical protein COLO4_06442 [Corchorus olitorius]|uniref:Uncharacterized protein n=1 Tax=Corchorus olitorius TaxID=93759 RepID=A0A1R3KN89_9ROSI|nr:hypothetical protein COLO4_06442 [Corchorus olitorius]
MKASSSPFSANPLVSPSITNPAASRASPTQSHRLESTIPLGESKVVSFSRPRRRPEPSTLKSERFHRRNSLKF